jgi:RHS repeat-associated protein
MPAGRRQPPAQVRSTSQARMGDTLPPAALLKRFVPYSCQAVGPRSLIHYSPQKNPKKPASNPLLAPFTIYGMNVHPITTPASPFPASPLLDASCDSIESLTTSFVASVVPTIETTTVTEAALGYHRNQQYSITAMTTSTGAVAERYAYTAYGQPTILNASGTVLTSSAVGNRYTYTGREWDETLGLHHFRARWMSPLAGRFLGRDPIGYWDGLGVYKVTNGRVLVSVDPHGLCTHNWRGPCTMQNFFAWIQNEILELNTWLPKLKPCPCNLTCKIPGHTVCLGMKWVPPTTVTPCRTAPPGFVDMGWQTNIMGDHEGAVYELRENNCSGTCEPGNQCTYDAQGTLLTQPTGAGTSDRYTGGCGASSDHYYADKKPWDCAVDLDKNSGNQPSPLNVLAQTLYFTVRPINGGKPCDPTIWTVPTPSW